MRRITRFLTAGILTLALIACAASTAGAEPGKNQITVSGAQCDNGEEITFVLNAMGKTLKLPEGEGNLVVKDYTLVYKEPGTDNVLETVEYGGGKKDHRQTGDLVTCRGGTATEIVGFGLVIIDFELEGFFTPRG